MSDRPILVAGRKRSLFAGRASPQPLEVFPGPVRKKVGPVYAPTMLPRSPPERQQAASVGVSGSVPYSASWLHTPVPLRWKPALILQLAVGNGSNLAVPIPWYAVNETLTPPVGGFIRLIKVPATPSHSLWTGIVCLSCSRCENKKNDNHA